MDYFNTRFVYDKRRRIFWRIFSDYLIKKLKLDRAGLAVADLGAGYCEFINNVEAAKKYAVDKYIDLEKYVSSDVIPLKSGSSDLSKIADDSIDLVFCSNLLEHLEFKEIKGTFSEALRALKKGGYFVVVSPNFKYCYREYFDDFTHRTALTHIGLSDFLASAGFSVIFVKKRFLPFSFKSRFPINSLIIKLYLKMPVKLFAKQMMIIASKPC